MSQTVEHNEKRDRDRLTRFYATYLERQLRVDKTIELLLILGDRPSKIIEVIRATTSIAWRDVSLTTLHRYIRMAKEDIYRRSEIMRDEMYTIAMARSELIYSKLMQEGDYYKANLVNVEMLNRIAGKPGQTITVEHNNLSPQTIIQINGTEVNLSIHASDVPPALPLQPQEILPEKKWYEIQNEEQA